jgi:signal transduction histidine kinase
MIKGYAEVMRDIPDENTPENVQVIIDEAAHLSDMVSDMLDISKIHSGAQKLTIEEFSISDTVREVLGRYEKLTEHDGYSIDFVSDGEYFVSADRSMMVRVLYNLINNAINYTGDDKRVVLTQTYNEKTNAVRISVSDSGDGIGKDDLDAVWDRYYKVDKVHKRAKIGTGLGLSIVKGILEAHGCAYGVESRVDEGSNFWFEMEMFRSVACDEISP